MDRANGVAQEIADLFAKARSRVDDKGATHTYPRRSRAGRNRWKFAIVSWSLPRSSSMRRSTRYGRRSRAIESPEKAAAQPLAEQAMQNAADRTVEAASSKGAAATANERVSIDTSLETLKDPAKFAATVDTVAKTSCDQCGTGQGHARNAA